MTFNGYQGGGEREVGKRGRNDAFSLHGSDGDPAWQEKEGLVNTAVGWSL